MLRIMNKPKMQYKNLPHQFSDYVQKFREMKYTKKAPCDLYKSAGLQNVFHEFAQKLLH